ncbi:hypothetical protein [Bradyrhizobium sp. DASA03007]|uniref:hypothetical protein n=1 Tax=unclassified Bradyrhizobium TaxID=2631580 RepID=UPI003F707D3A
MAAWLVDHPDDVTHEVRFEAIDFMHKTIDAVETYPCTVYVPTHLVDAINGVIDDWTEVLSAHDENFETNLVIP